FTKASTKAVKSIIGVEIDNSLYYNLKKDNKLQDNVQHINKDILNSQFPDSKDYKIFGSIPYNITTEIIKKILYESKAEYNYLIVELGFAKRIQDKNKALSLLLLPKLDVNIFKVITNKYILLKSKLEL